MYGAVSHYANIDIILLNIDFLFLNIDPYLSITSLWRRKGGISRVTTSPL